MEKQAEGELRAVVGGARRTLQRLRAGGLQDLPMKRRAKPAAEGPAQAKPASTRSIVPAPTACAAGSPEKTAAIGPVRTKALACTKCRLAKERTTVVFGEGSLDAEIAFVGEGPGRDEDESGRPFVGAAGKLLTKIIEAMGKKREEVYICNVVKCRPPMNRPPEPDEAAACSEYLVAQLTTIQPKIIIALGRTAASALLETEAPMSMLRGKTFEWRGMPLTVTFHPAYLLRNPSAKGEVWKDMQRVLEFLKKP